MIEVCRLAWRGRHGPKHGEWMRSSTRQGQAAAVADRQVATRGFGSCWVEEALLPEAAVTASEARCLALAHALLERGAA